MSLYKNDMSLLIQLFYQFKLFFISFNHKIVHRSLQTLIIIRIRWSKLQCSKSRRIRSNVNVTKYCEGTFETLLCICWLFSFNLCLLYFFSQPKKETENAVWTHFIPILYVALLKFSEALLYTKIQYKSIVQSRKTEVFNHILCACNQCK